MAVMTTGNKVWTLGAGLAIGSVAAAGAHVLLPSPERDSELDAQGISTISHREALATFGPMAFVTAAAIGGGLGKRSSNASLTTVSLGAAAMLASTGASTMINSDNESAGAYMRTLGLMSLAAGAGFAIGAPTVIPEMVAKSIGLGLIGVAGGMLVPDTVGYVAALPGELGRSVSHRGEAAATGSGGPASSGATSGTAGEPATALGAAPLNFARYLDSIELPSPSGLAANSSWHDGSQAHRFELHQQRLPALADSSSAWRPADGLSADVMWLGAGPQRPAGPASR